MKKVTLIELTAFDKITPLASAYLTTYARADEEVAAGCEIDIYAAPVTTDADTVTEDLVQRRSDVYGLSCYLWNMGLMRRLLDRLTRELPEARIVLGGPQVMNHAEEYVAPELTNVAVCNGEGERTFREYLRQLLSDEPDLSAVPGISFWNDGRLVTTERAERIRDLTEIPSPFTGGLFEPGKYTFAILETNRGCPYRCGFCFWGAATNSKVNRFETQRVFDDISWMSENGVITIFLADANWGMAPRDVEFTRHMVECRKRTGYPMMIGMNSAKNKPDRVAEITRILVSGGLLTSQPISLQSMDGDVLNLIDRSNIRPETYTELQRTLRDEDISSFIEMIWPLPGETTETFRKGITELCRSRADTILVYSQLLLHNTPIHQNRERLGLRVHRLPDDVAEADVVVGTNWVTREEYDEGVWLYYATQALYNLRGLYYLANHLDRTGRVDFGDLFAAAAEFFKQRPDSAVCRFIADSVRDLGTYRLLNAGELAHLVLHSERREFDRLLLDFVSEQPFWADADARAMFELGVLARPYIYRERPGRPDIPFAEIDLDWHDDGSATVTVPQAAAELLAELDRSGSIPDRTLVLSHPLRRKLPYTAAKNKEDNLSYCQGMTLHLREMLPEYSAAANRPCS